MNRFEQEHWQHFYGEGQSHPLVTTETLLGAIETTQITRRYIAGLYAYAMRVPIGEVNYGRVNEAITKRWSVSGLNWILRLANNALETAVTA